MKEVSYTFRSAWRIALLAATLTVGACDAVNEAVDAIDDIGNDGFIDCFISRLLRYHTLYHIKCGTSLNIQGRFWTK